MSLFSLRTLIAAVAAFALLVPSVLSVAAQNVDDVPTNASQLLSITASVDASVSAGDWATAQSTWSTFDDTWNTVEDGFRAQDRDGYRALESHQGLIQRLLRESAPDSDQIHSEIAAINTILTGFGGVAAD